mmetsp:Transcript_8459/g.21644  ORF Transcript_8459/g.21644 Transcript_8459/m.21644 type:complete len:203 (+) Transcript_8459:1371-1979(+)
MTRRSTRRSRRQPQRAASRSGLTIFVEHRSRRHCDNAPGRGSDVRTKRSALSESEPPFPRRWLVGGGWALRDGRPLGAVEDGVTLLHLEGRLAGIALVSPVFNFLQRKRCRVHHCRVSCLLQHPALKHRRHVVHQRPPVCRGGGSSCGSGPAPSPASVLYHLPRSIRRYRFGNFVLENVSVHCEPALAERKVHHLVVPRLGR